MTRRDGSPHTGIQSSKCKCYLPAAFYFKLANKYLQDRAPIARAAYLGHAVIDNDQPVDATNRFYTSVGKFSDEFNCGSVSFVRYKSV